jgi:AcrR family transcriptional regulator
MSAQLRTTDTCRETSERLLAAAEMLILRGGAAGLRVRSIAEEADANAALVSYYFGGIQGLLAELLSINAARIHASRNELLEQAVHLRTPAARLDALIHAYVDPIWLVHANWNAAPARTVVRECLNVMEARLRTRTVAAINASVEAVAVQLLPLLPNLTHTDLVTRLRLLSGATEMLQPRLDTLGLFPDEGAISQGRQKYLETALLNFARGALRAP